MGPPESEIGVAVPVRSVFPSPPGIAIALTDCVAFSNGFEFGIAVRARHELKGEEIGFGPPHLRGGFGTERQLKIGVQFADGRRATGGNPGAAFMDYLEAARAGREPVVNGGPILSHRSGGGGGKTWDFRYWVWPLPPEGRLTFTCEWPERNLAETTYEVNGAEILLAGLSSTKLWDEA